MSLRVLVTGSAGFLGRALVQRLEREGHTVLGLDRDAAPVRGKSWRADLLEGAPAALPSFDVCCHLASEVGGFLHNAGSAPLERYELALLAAAERLCCQRGCRRFIYTSSIAVFEAHGDFPAGPLRARDQRTAYARAKAAGEAFVTAAFREQEQAAVVRPTNLFGPHQRRVGARVGESHVIPELLAKIARGPVLEVLGDGAQRRNFLHVDDAADFLARLVAEPVSGFFNLRSDLELSIGELAQRLLRFTGRTLPVVFRPSFLRYEPTPIRRFHDPAVDALGWRARVDSLERGLRGNPRARAPGAPQAMARVALG